MEKTSKPFPGESATPEQVFRLAEQYRAAALVLLPQGRPGDPLSLAPCRFLAAHAIELYLNCLLRHAGCEPSLIRKLQHNFSARSDLAATKGLVLRKRTAAHLVALASNREHVATRYAAEAMASVHQINRITATLAELAEKVDRMVKDVVRQEK